MGYKKYTDEFKREVLAMVAEGKRSVAQLERDLDITSGLIYKWRQRYRVMEERLQPSEERAEQAEVRRLKRELEVVKQERDILKKPFRCSRKSDMTESPRHTAGTGSSVERNARLAGNNTASYTTLLANSDNAGVVPTNTQLW